MKENQDKPSLPRKLSLTRETLRDLGEEEPYRINGGFTAIICSIVASVVTATLVLCPVLPFVFKIKCKSDGVSCGPTTCTVNQKLCTHK